MVATLLRLKFSLTKNSLKRQPWTIVFLIIGGVSALGMIPLIGAGAFALSFADVDIAATVIILVGAIAILGWSLLPLLIFGSDETLDPARFATLHVPPRQLTTGLLLSGFVGVPGLITGILVFFPALTWIHHPLAAVAAILMAPIAVLSCFAFSRLLTTLTANSLRSRRGRDALGIVAFLALLGLPQLTHLFSGIEDSGNIVDILHSVASVVAWTPFGAPWAIPVDLIAGDFLTALARAVVAVGVLALALIAWSRALQKAMISTTESHISARRANNSIAVSVSRPWAKIGDTATWAIVARCLRYWRSDPRYIINAVMVVFLPAVFIIMKFTAGDLVDDPGSISASYVPFPDIMLAAVGPFLAMIVGWSLHNDIGSDSTAFWTHVSTGVSGRADRVGRTIAMSIWFIPVGAFVIIGTTIMAGQGEHLPALLGVGAALYFAGCGVSAVTSAILTYPVALPGASPFKSQTGGGGVTVAAQMLSTFVVVVLAAPALALLACDIFIGPVFGWLTLAVGILGGLGVAALGIHKGASVYETRSVRLLAQLVKADD